jgi:MFS-type transporter involved in bile tolerance (Atg22 family)
VESVSSGVGDVLIKTRKSDATMIMHIGTLLGVLVFPWLCERIGRKPAFALFFVASPLAVLAAVYGATTYVRLLWLLPLMTFFPIGLSAGFALYFPELFPTRLRATGLGLAYNTSRIVSAPFPVLTAALTGKGQGIGVGVARAAAIYVVGLVALAFAPETKGKPLPEE